PTNFQSIFDEFPAYLMRFTIGGVALTCHFFTPTEIEFSFDPKDVTEPALHDLLAFMIDIGDTTKKRVIMTPENWPQAPIFRYDSNRIELKWISLTSNRD